MIPFTFKEKGDPKIKVEANQVHRNNGPKGGKAKSKDKPKAKGKGKEVDNVKGPEVYNKSTNYINGGRVPPKNLPRNSISHI
jgi:hypothetical protein